MNNNININLAKNILITSCLFFIFNSITSSAENIIEIKNPIFTTKSIDGNPYEIKAERGFQNEDYLDLFIIKAKLKTKNNLWIYLNADRGKFNQSSGEIYLEDNIEVYTEAKQKISAEKANVNANNKIITLIKNVQYQDSNIFISADRSLIKNDFSNITYYGNVKSRIIESKINE